MATPVRVGLVGAGPWAQLVHAPALAGSPGTELAAVWARRPEAAAALVSRHGGVVAGSYDDLLDRCDAVAFAVPPDVQARLGARAATAGKALLLEKPLALDLAGAEQLAAAVAEAGVASQLVLTWRYAPAVRAFLDRVRSGPPPIGGRGWMISGAFLGGPFATPWRLEHGCLLDLGPHVVDLLEAALGRVVGVKATGDPRRWVGLLLEHEGGVTSEASLSARSAIEPTRAGIEVFTEAGLLALDGATAVGPEAVRTVVAELAATAGGTPHALDAHHGLHLQRVLHDAAADLGRSGSGGALATGR